MGNGNLLFETIFKRNLSEDDTREFLVNITNEHPYFSPAQFFLLLKTEKGTTDYVEQASKTAILFNNPYWLQFQLQEKLDSIETDDNDGASELIPEIIENREKVPGINNEIIEPRDNSESISLIHAEDENNELPPAFIDEQHVPETAEEFTGDQEGTEAGPLIDNSIHDEPPLAVTVQFPPEDDVQPVTDNIIAQEITDEGNLEGTEIGQEPAVDLPVSQQENQIEEITAETGSPVNNEEKPVPGIPGNNEQLTGPTHSGHFNDDDSPLVNETDEEVPSTQQEIEPLSFKLNIHTADTTEENITFEPLHTSDYFASLGIKLGSDIKPSDKLGKQLKSFTEWLKTMKKLHNDQLPPLTGQADISIQKLAEQSNKDDDIVTEAMADVLLQQGKADKALEVYKKLSLLNPSKSAYFAAKIDQLKEQ